MLAGILVITNVCTWRSGLSLSLVLFCLPAFMAEFHKMAGVINGVAQCFAMEDQECEWEGLWGRGRGTWSGRGLGARIAPGVGVGGALGKGQGFWSESGRGFEAGVE